LLISETGFIARASYAVVAGSLLRADALLRAASTSADVAASGPGAAGSAATGGFSRTNANVVVQWLSEPSSLMCPAECPTIVGGFVPVVTPCSDDATMVFPAHDFLVVDADGTGRRGRPRGRIRFLALEIWRSRQHTRMRRNLWPSMSRQ
jgi:hypothetical protein